MADPRVANGSTLTLAPPAQRVEAPRAGTDVLYVEAIRQALFEEMSYGDRGQLLNANLGDYNIPSFEDIPWKLNPIALEHDGSKDIHGIGETLLPPVMAAIGNAVYNAVGVRIHDLPVTAEKVLRELGRAGASPTQ